MNTQAVTLHLPTTLYERMEYAAQMQQRPIETLLLDAVTASAPLLEDLPPELAEEMSALTLLNDNALWEVAQRTLSEAQQQELDELLYAKGRGDLSLEDQQCLDALLTEYELVVLARAQAAVLLQLRGYDVSDPSVLNASVV